MRGQRPEWQLSLFPTLQLALLAVIRLSEPAGLVLVGERSILNHDVSAASVARDGYIIRTFEEHEQPPRTPIGPQYEPRLAVYDTVDDLMHRLSNSATADQLSGADRHVESLRIDQLRPFMAGEIRGATSATVLFPGCPAAVGLIIATASAGRLRHICAALGLHYGDYDLSARQ